MILWSLLTEMQVVNLHSGRGAPASRGGDPAYTLLRSTLFASPVSTNEVFNFIHGLEHAMRRLKQNTRRVKQDHSILLSWQEDMVIPRRSRSLAKEDAPSCGLAVVPEMGYGLLSGEFATDYASPYYNGSLHWCVAPVAQAISTAAEGSQHHRFSFY
jgi:hypothetical protein